MISVSDGDRLVANAIGMKPEHWKTRLFRAVVGKSGTHNWHWVCAEIHKMKQGGADLQGMSKPQVNSFWQAVRDFLLAIECLGLVRVDLRGSEVTGVTRRW